MTQKHKRFLTIFVIAFIAALCAIWVSNNFEQVGNLVEQKGNWFTRLFS